MEACLTVEREVDKVKSKFDSYSANFNKQVEEQLKQLGIKFLTFKIAKLLYRLLTLIGLYVSGAKTRFDFLSSTLLNDFISIDTVFRPFRAHQYGSIHQS